MRRGFRGDVLQDGLREGQYGGLSVLRTHGPRDIDEILAADLNNDFGVAAPRRDGAGDRHAASLETSGAPAYPRSMVNSNVALILPATATL